LKLHFFQKQKTTKTRSKTSLKNKKGHLFSFFSLKNTRQIIMMLLEES